MGSAIITSSSYSSFGEIARILQILRRVIDLGELSISLGSLIILGHVL